MGPRVIIEGLTNNIIKEYDWTRELLDRTPDDWFWRRTEYSANAIGWHAGHITYHLDDVHARLWAVAPVYGAERKRLFGVGCAPVPVDEFPAPATMRADFVADHQRLFATLATLDDSALTRTAPHSNGALVVFRVGEILAHLAEHSGGIQTLLDYFEGLGTKG